jgi:hypothetical protein
LFLRPPGGRALDSPGSLGSADNPRLVETPRIPVYWSHPDCGRDSTVALLHVARVTPAYSMLHSFCADPANALEQPRICPRWRSHNRAMSGCWANRASVHIAAKSLFPAVAAERGGGKLAPWLRAPVPDPDHRRPTVRLRTARNQVSGASPSRVGWPAVSLGARLAVVARWPGVAGATGANFLRNAGRVKGYPLPADGGERTPATTGTPALRVQGRPAFH